MGRGFGVAATVSGDVIRVVAKEAEELGYSSFWANDPGNADGLTALAAAAEVTSQIQLGVGVIPLDRRSPQQIAADIEKLRVPQDRLLLGVGSGGDQRGLTLVRNGIDELRSLVSASIVISALGPKMSALSGEAADGVLFNWFTPEFTEEAGRWVTDASDASGRPRTRLMAYVRAALLPQAEAQLDIQSGRYAAIPQYARHFERMGVSARDTCAAAPDAATLQARIAEHEHVLDETIVRSITADESAESILELLRACAPPRS